MDNSNGSKQNLQKPGNSTANDLAPIIQQMIEAQTDKFKNRTFRRGIVGTAHGSYADVFIEGSTVATKNILSLASYIPQTGDKVMVLSIGDTGTNLLVLGKLDTAPEDTDWITPPSLLNGWVNYDASTHATMQYMKDSQGFVHLKGLVKNGTAPISIVLNLPAGFRPPLVEHFSTISAGAFGGIRVDSNGNVQFEAVSASWASLAGVTFKAAQ